MAGSGVCCASLEDHKALMKMGLSVILVGHVNFLLAALVHGVVLRHINLHKQARAMEYAISNVVALTSGLVGIIVGILAIILSKNKRRRDLMWAVFTLSLLAALMAAASAVGLTVSVVRAIMYGGRSLLTHCRFPDAIGYSSVTNECPFDPTRIYSTTLILWVPLIVTCVVQLVFTARCFTACVSFLGLPCCHAGTRSRTYRTAINVERPVVDDTLPSQTRLLRSHDEPLRTYTEPPRRVAAAPRHQRRPLPPPLPPPQQSHPSHRRSLPPAQRKAPRQPAGEGSGRAGEGEGRGRRGREGREGSGSGGHQRPPEQHQLLQRGTTDRSSFWI